MILLGTLSPLIHEAIYGEANRISIGPPYYNIMFIPLMAILAFFLGASTFSRWKKTSLQHLVRNLKLVLVASVTLGIVLPLAVASSFNPSAMLALVLAFWIVFSIVKDLHDKTANKASRWQGLLGLGRSYCGMQLAHFGMAVIITGVCLTSHYSIEQDVRMAPGESITINDYTFTFGGVGERPGPNYTAQSATVDVSIDGEAYITLRPEKPPITPAAMSRPKPISRWASSAICSPRSAIRAAMAPGSCGCTSNRSFSGSGLALS